MSDFAVLDCSKDCWQKAMPDSPSGRLRFHPVVSDHSGAHGGLRGPWESDEQSPRVTHVMPLILKCFRVFSLQTRTLFYITTVYLTNSGNLKVLQ